MSVPRLAAPDVWAMYTAAGGLELTNNATFEQLLKITGTPEQLLALVAEIRAEIIENLPTCDRCSRPVLPDGSHP